MVMANGTIIPQARPREPGLQAALEPKIAVAATSPSLSAPVAASLGAAPYLIIYNLRTGETELVAKNPLPNQGAGAVQSAHTIIDKGASAVIAGNISPSSVQTLSSLGVFSFAGFNGRVDQAIAMYRDGKLQATTVPTQNRAAVPLPGLAAQQGITL